MSSLAILFIGSNTTDAQVNLYSFSQSAGTFTPITGTILGTATGNVSATNLNSEVYPVTLPFGFVFNGTSYSSINVSSNGFVTFGTITPTTTNTTPISSTADYDGAISVFGRDLNSIFDISGITGNISWGVSGTAPNRELVIQWKDFRPTNATATTSVYAFSFQIRLQETSNLIKMVYSNGAYVVGNTSYASTAQIGLRGEANSDFVNRLNSTSLEFTSSTSGTANSSSQAFSTTNAVPGMPSSGLTYTWTPPSCWVPQGLSFLSSNANSANLSWSVPPSSPLGYDIYISTSTVPPTSTTTPTISNVAGISVTIPQLNASTNYYAWIRSNCGSGNISIWTPKFIQLSTFCQPSTLTVNTPQAICPNATATLSASADTGAVINWYDSASGGTPIATGSTFTTPSLTTTTNYWVSAANNTMGYVGMPAPISTSSSLGLIFDAIKPMNIETVDIYPVHASSTSGTVSIDLKNASNVTLQTVTANVVVNPTGALNTVPLNFAVPAGTGYKLVVTAKSTTISTFIRESDTSNFSFPYTLSGVCLITGTTTANYYYYLYNWKISSLCESPLQQVIAIVDSGCLSTEETDKRNAIKIYPNPFSEVIHINKPELVKVIKLTDISGKLIRSFSNPETTLQLNDLSAGIYILQINMKDGSSQSIKVIKK